MTTTITHDLVRAPIGDLDGTNSFLVTRQRRDGSRRYERLGVLTRLEQGWAFRYFQQTADDPTISRLPGLPDAGRAAVSEYLFPVFSERVLSPRRPDRARILHSLGLPGTAGPFEILARNGGRRQGDTIELIPLPIVDSTEDAHLQFLVHGMRYRTPEEQVSVDALSIGDDLVISPDDANTQDPHAQFVMTVGDVVLGWVPAPLSPLVDRVRGMRASVAHVNGREATPHLRLLVEIRGPLLDAAEFSHPRWRLVT